MDSKLLNVKNKLKQYRTIGTTGTNNSFYQHSPVIVPARIYSVCAVFCSYKFTIDRFSIVKLSEIYCITILRIEGVCRSTDNDIVPTQRIVLLKVRESEYRIILYNANHARVNSVPTYCNVVVRSSRKDGILSTTVVLCVAPYENRPESLNVQKSQYT